jgi:hypothetical protein
MSAANGDDRLRAQFRALADEEARGAPAFSREPINARRALVRARRITASATAVLAVAAVATFIAWPRTPSLSFDLTGVSWSTPTDFLLNTPGSDLLSSMPAIAVVAYEPPPAATGSGDTSERNQ